MFEKRTFLSFKISCPFSLPELIAEKRVKVLSNEGTWPFRKGDNKQIAKKHWQKLKLSFSRTAGPIFNHT